jgi:hypothetical protein
MQNQEQATGGEPAPTTEPNPAVVKQIADVKTARVEIDAIIQRLRTMDPTEPVKASIVKLQEGIMWLGMELKRIRDQFGVGNNPYPESYNPASPRIETTADNLKL